MNIRNGHQLHALAGTERLARRARAAPAHANERDFQSVAGRSRVRETFDGQRAERRRAPRRFGSIRNKTPTSQSLETEIILSCFWFCSDARLARGYSTVENGSAQSVAISSPPVQPGIGVGQRKNFSHG